MKRLIVVLFLIGCGGDTAANNANNGNNQNNIPYEGDEYDGLAINEIAATGNPDDWFELYNFSENDIDLSGLTYSDTPTEPARAQLTGTIGAGDFVQVILTMDVGFGLGGGEQLGIYKDGEAIDSINWDLGDSLVDRSFGRIPDGEGEFKRLNTPSPGEANIDNNPGDPLCGNDETEGDEVCDGTNVDGLTCTAMGFSGGDLACAATCRRFDFEACTFTGGDVVINELASRGGDNIELFNNGAAEVDLAGWSISDEEFLLGEMRGYTFPTGTTLGAGAYLLLVKDMQHTFGVGGSDSLILFNADGDVVDRIRWSSPDAEVSYCRTPNGTGEFQTCEASFGAAN